MLKQPCLYRSTVAHWHVICFLPWRSWVRISVHATIYIGCMIHEGIVPIQITLIYAIVPCVITCKWQVKILNIEDVTTSVHLYNNNYKWNCLTLALDFYFGTSFKEKKLNTRWELRPLSNTKTENRLRYASGPVHHQFCYKHRPEDFKTGSF